MDYDNQNTQTPEQGTTPPVPANDTPVAPVAPAAPPAQEAIAPDQAASDAPNLGNYPPPPAAPEPPPTYMPPPGYTPPQQGYAPPPPPQGGYQPPPQGYPQAPAADPLKGKAIAALVLGILSIVFCWVPILGIVLGVIAIVLGGQCRKSCLRGPGGAYSLAMGGFVTGIIGTVFSVIYNIIYFIFVIFLGAASMSTLPYYMY